MPFKRYPIRIPLLPFPIRSCRCHAPRRKEKNNYQKEAFNGDIAANRQFRTIDEEADYAEHWILSLTAQQALRKASVLSEDFWLKDFLENFCIPT